jgi:hypothetical protein
MELTRSGGHLIVTKQGVQDAGYTTAGISHKAKLLISLLRLWGESIYEGLGVSLTVQRFEPTKYLFACSENR